MDQKTGGSALQGSFADENHLIQTGPFDAAHKPFREGIQVGRSSRQPHRFDPGAL